MRSQLKYMVVSFAVACSSMLFAGNWTLSGGVLTSSDGQWSFSGASRNAKTLTVGACTSSAADGILDFRDTVVDGNAITTITIARNTTWGAANIKEFYCDTLTQVIASLFSGNTTLEKIQTSHLNNTGILGNAFKGCTSLVTASFGAKITSSAVEGFSGCRNLDVDAAEFIAPTFSASGNSAFSSCAKLHGKLTLTTFDSLRLGTFSGTGIEELVLESPNFTTFPNKVFNGCRSLTNVTISCVNLTTLGSTSNPFENCTALEKVTFNLPAVTTVATQTSAHYFSGCSAIKEVVFKNVPWNSTLTRRWLNQHVLCSVSAVAATVDAPKNCTIYALRSDYKPYASAMTGDYEKLYAPKRCYGVYCNGSSRLAYMAQPPDYKSGFTVSFQ